MLEGLNNAGPVFRGSNNDSWTSCMLDFQFKTANTEFNTGLANMLQLAAATGQVQPDMHKQALDLLRAVTEAAEARAVYRGKILREHVINSIEYRTHRMGYGFGHKELVFRHLPHNESTIRAPSHGLRSVSTLRATVTDWRLNG